MRGIDVADVSPGCVESVCDSESRVEIAGRLVGELAAVVRRDSLAG